MHIPEINEPIVDDGIAGVDYLMNGIRKIIVKILKTDMIHWKVSKMTENDTSIDMVHNFTKSRNKAWVSPIWTPYNMEF